MMLIRYAMTLRLLLPPCRHFSRRLIPFLSLRRHTRHADYAAMPLRCRHAATTPYAAFLSLFYAFMPYNSPCREDVCAGRVQRCSDMQSAGAPRTMRVAAMSTTRVPAAALSFAPARPRTPFAATPFTPSGAAHIADTAAARSPQRHAAITGDAATSCLLIVTLVAAAVCRRRRRRQPPSRQRSSAQQPPRARLSPGTVYACCRR